MATENRQSEAGGVASRMSAAYSAGAAKRMWPPPLLVPLAILVCLSSATAEILAPPYFNLAEGRKITATATCGDEGEELYCKLVGAKAQDDYRIIGGQECHSCDLSVPSMSHPPEYAVDGMDTWWMSPPLSRGMRFNEVNLTIDLGQEFHVAYVFVKMGISPRPDVWALEKSADYGKTYTPWQYFADSPRDCERYFGRDSLLPIIEDDSVVCNLEYSKKIPLEGGEIPISLLNMRPSAKTYFNSSKLQEWTRATNVRLRFLRTKSLFANLMSVERQDPTVTRRYFYSIKDISIGGRCMCNGHARTCDIPDPEDSNKLHCHCQHNTCGAQCERCCPGFEQKKWRQSQEWHKFVCEPCNCFNHSNECVYDAKVDEQYLSLDIHGKFEGGGVCKNCQHNTEGINCNKCIAKYYRPYNKEWNEEDVCKPCDCDSHYSTGNCAEGSGQCECRKEYQSPYCDACSPGYFGYPYCKPCTCNINGTDGDYCEPIEGECPCKSNYDGDYCEQCADGFYNFPTCEDCGCNREGALSQSCEQIGGNCTCKSNFAGRTCDRCEAGYYNYPKCNYCSCDSSGTLPSICNNNTGECLCKEGFSGARCDQCLPGYYNELRDKEHVCIQCNCSSIGSTTTTCDASGKCTCLDNFGGKQCNQCSPGYYNYPDCLPCNCDSHGALGITCDSDGQCQCKDNFENMQCSKCKAGYYNFPTCEECNCDPNGVTESFAGCGSVPPGELCECKPRVEGRICDKCKPLYWNLLKSNELGCEECECYEPGTQGGIGSCDTKSGQCVCKYNVVDRKCNTCRDGTFNLTKSSIFGCSDCNCDVGGSINGVCNKETGMCVCKPRITGQQCNEPIDTHYFPTLHQHQFEAEDGLTPSGNPVKYDFQQDEFPNYSWKGYAIFSLIQNEIYQDVVIDKSSLYQMVLRYVKPGPDTVTARITITPENPNEIEQSSTVLLKQTRIPQFVTVAGNLGTVNFPFVMAPGTWRVTIKSDKNIFLDYFVLIPSAYYEASILSKKVENPCVIGEKGLCRHFGYPLIEFDNVRGSEGYSPSGGNTLENDSLGERQAKELQESPIPLINDNQNELKLNLKISQRGEHVLLVKYATPIEMKGNAGGYITATIRGNNYQASSKVFLDACPYSTICNQVLLDDVNKIKIFNIEDKFVELSIKAEKGTVAGIASVTAIPQEEWEIDFIKPQSICVKKNGKCIASEFPIAQDSKKIEFESAATNVTESKPPNLYDNSTGLVMLELDTATLDSKVSNPGLYVIIVQYYQPYFPGYNMDVKIEEDQIYYATVAIKHCPSNLGCRSVVKLRDGANGIFLNEDFTFSITEELKRAVWLDYILVVPAAQYTDSLLNENKFDQTKEFILTCGKDHFNVNVSNEAGFCKDTVFSLTADYNNGAVPCNCDAGGSLSFECNKFGGQCQCKENIIGRQCEACKTGFYGFPDCKPCDCPFRTQCGKEKGECICPTNVIGEKCDQCMAYTYGFDTISGCLECNCDESGVLNNELQCDLFNGSCSCKENVVGRTCEQCSPGYFQFPDCDSCDCNIKGSLPDICDQDTAKCFCKPNVEGEFCDTCKEGTFNLQEENEAGCTKCFCFGKTISCNSANYYWEQIVDMENWSLYNILVSNNVTIEKIDGGLERESTSSLKADIPDDVKKIVYFSTSKEYLGNKLNIYGGFLNYTIFYTTMGYGNAVSHGDVILHGADVWLIHSSIEQPPSNRYWANSLQIVESEFITVNNLQATRELLMTVLEKLDGIYIRATYWESVVITRIQDVSLDAGTELWNKDSIPTNTVEQCDCPKNYQGNSCEDCAEGYYRIQTGLHGGYCVPCQCNNHATTCDVNTGICIDCKHNTYGDHCEMCIEGYHGNATLKSPNDCLICACPLPIASNNFATGCEVSPDGDKISCDCKDNYVGPQCESCKPGFYGRPRNPGDYCKPCQCSDNINPDDPAACDTLTGKCLKCMNNTFGEACNLCKPGYFGDAIVLKDCQVCMCDQLGMEKCDSYTGTCICKEGVIGEKCDRCEIDHWGFEHGEGCRSCNCSIASDSTQCDDADGKCKCKPGVTGKNCDRCAPGFWNFSENGCINCGCNSEYSRGFGCNAVTGKCECLPNVIGDKCDKCPYRNVLVQDEGCLACDSCTHDLLNSTDDLERLIDPVIVEFGNKASGYFTHQRLVYIDEQSKKLEGLLKKLDPNAVNLVEISKKVDELKGNTKNLARNLEYSIEAVNKQSEEVNKTDQLCDEIRNSIDEGSINSKLIVNKIEDLARNLELGEGPKVESALAEAQQILSDMKVYDLTSYLDNTEFTSANVTKLLKRIKQLFLPVDNHTKAYENLNKLSGEFDKKLIDLMEFYEESESHWKEAEKLNNRNSGTDINNKIKVINLEEEKVGKNLKEAGDLLKNTSNIFNDLKKGVGKAKDEVNNAFAINDLVNKTLNRRDNDFKRIMEDPYRHSDNISALANRIESLFEFDNRNPQTEAAVKAVSSYSDIIKEIDTAYNASQEAKQAHENAAPLVNGLNERVEESKKISDDLYATAKKISIEIPNAKKIMNDVEAVKKKTNDVTKAIISKSAEIDEAINNIKESSDKIGKALKSANNTSDAAATEANKIRDASRKLDTEHMLENTKILVKERNDVINNMQLVNQQLDKWNSMHPNMSDSLGEIKEKQNEYSLQIRPLEDRRYNLQKEVATAKDIANRIPLGASFDERVTLRLPLPDNVDDMTTTSHVSAYFKTPQENGFLMYLGNLEGTKLRRTRKDDFMALEIENGHPVLTMDLGDEPERIFINDKYVSDDEWYQVIVDRVGKHVKLTVQNENGNYSKERTLPGINTMLNLNKDQSKLFVGGYPNNYKIQSDVRFSTFQGKIEDLVIGDTPVGLWNFIEASGNMDGASRPKSAEKEKTGYRFDGNGYVILDGRTYNMKENSFIQIRFKTSAKDGLLFLVGKGKSFQSIEMRNGIVYLQFRLGGDVASISTPDAYNDGEWHKITATRNRLIGVLEVDDKFIGQETSTGNQTTLPITDHFYFGGYPNKHNYIEVTDKGFDGCIDDVKISTTPVNLASNVKAYGVKPGCPMKITKSVTFDKDFGGYVKQSNISVSNDFLFAVKFKTSASNGLIFYATDKDQSAGISLSMVNGVLIAKSQKEQLSTGSNTYNDDQWHVVTTIHDNNALRIIVDDFDHYSTDNAPPKLHFMYGEVYIGGLPSKYVVDTRGPVTIQTFTGCIGDAVLDKVLINFVNAVNKYNETLQECSTKLQKSSFGIPLIPDNDGDAESIPSVSIDENEKKLRERERQLEKERERERLREVEREKMREKEKQRQKEADRLKEIEKQKQLEREKEIEKAKQAVSEKIKLLPPIKPTDFEIDQKPPEMKPTNNGQITTQPMVPQEDSCPYDYDPLKTNAVSSSNSYRFGTRNDTRIEFSQLPDKYKNAFNLSVDFKTHNEDGLIFYSDSNFNKDYFWIYIKEGKIHFTFNCGTGSANLVSEKTYNDDNWHNIVLHREQNMGKLFVDNELVDSGESPGTGKSIVLQSPFYYGGIGEVTEDIKKRLMGSYTQFSGCLRNLRINDKPVVDIQKEINVIPCVESQEKGVYFGSAGGYLKIEESFKVGLEMTILMEIKPRNTSGLLVSVRGKKDYLILEIVNNTVVLRVDNGKGAFEAFFKLSNKFFLCDGKWHMIQALKSKNVVSVGVDGSFSQAGIGPDTPSTDTKFPLFIGGHPRIAYGVKGVTVRNNFFGCIRKLEIRGKEVDIPLKSAYGDAYVGSCPAN